MCDNPSKIEIEEKLGGKLSDDFSIEYNNNIPTDVSNTKYFLVMTVKNKYMLFKKSMFGKVIGIYVFLCGTGFPIPSLYDSSEFILKESINLTSIVYNHLNDLACCETFLINPQTISLEQINVEKIEWDNLPIGTEIYSLSGDMLQEITPKIT